MRIEVLLGGVMLAVLLTSLTPACGAQTRQFTAEQPRSLGSAFAGQRERESALSDAEVETLRELADRPPDRLLAFVDFLNVRLSALDKLDAGRRRPGREEDIHDLMEQMTSILNDLEDNLDDYGEHHKDVRKVLPKVIAATERWATALKTPVEDTRYAVSRKLTLEAVADVREQAAKMVDEQKAYFLAHPPAKEGPHGRGL